MRRRIRARRPGSARRPSSARRRLRPRGLNGGQENPRSRRPRPPPVRRSARPRYRRCSRSLSLWRASSSSPSAMGTASWARMGPSSTSMVAMWMVQPVTFTPAARASATAWAPRNDGSRLGWVLITLPGKAVKIGSASTVMNPAMATRSTPWAVSASTMALVSDTRSGRCSLRSTTTVGMPAAADRSRAPTPGRSVTTTATGRPASMIACRFVPLPEAAAQPHTRPHAAPPPLASPE